MNVEIVCPHCLSEDGNFYRKGLTPTVLQGYFDDQGKWSTVDSEYKAPTNFEDELECTECGKKCRVIDLVTKTKLG